MTDKEAFLHKLRASARARAQENYDVAVHNLQVDRQLSGLEPLDEPLQELDLTTLDLDADLSAAWRRVGNQWPFHDEDKNEDDLRSIFGRLFQQWLSGKGDMKWEAARHPEDHSKWYVTKNVLTLVKLTWGGQ